MNVSIAATVTKRDPRQYRWLEYVGRKAVLHVIGSDKSGYEIELTKGEKIGIKKHRGSLFLIDASDLTVQFKLDKNDGQRVVDNSKGYSGKVGRYKVMPAEGGKDPDVVKEKRKDSEGRLRLTADSSVFSALLYDPKTERLYIQFKSGAVWEYSEVTKREAMGFEKAASQGRWFHKKIRGFKPEVPIDRMPD